MSGRFFTPDLTAFEHEWQDAPRLVEDQAADRNRVVSRQNDRQAVVRGTRADEATERKRLLRPASLSERAAKEKLASPVVSHAQHSRNSRVEKARASCKERPEPDRVKRGRGSGKAFVPWCDRKR